MFRRSTRPVWIIALMILATASIFTVLAVASTQAHQPEPPGYDSEAGIELGTKAAAADWYYNCYHSRHSHQHPGKTHTFKDIATWSEGGRHYHRGTWVTFDWSREKVVASDRRTYDCTGAHGRQAIPKQHVTLGLIHGGAENLPVKIIDWHIALGFENAIVRGAVERWDYMSGMYTETLIVRGYQPLRIDLLGSPSGTGTGGTTYLEHWNGHPNSKVRVCGDKTGDWVDAVRGYDSASGNYIKASTHNSPTAAGYCGVNFGNGRSREFHQGGTVVHTYEPQANWGTARWLGPRDYH